MNPDIAIDPNVEADFEGLSNLFEAVKASKANIEERFNALEALGNEISKKMGRKPKKFDNDICENMKQKLSQYNEAHSCGLQESEITSLAGYIAGGILQMVD